MMNSSWLTVVESTKYLTQTDQLLNRKFLFMVELIG